MNHKEKSVHDIMKFGLMHNILYTLLNVIPSCVGNAIESNHYKILNDGDVMDGKVVIYLTTRQNIHSRP